LLPRLLIGAPAPKLRLYDTGGAIIGYNFDVYCAPPRTLVLHARRRQHVFVLPPGTRLRGRARLRCR
jgi:hypothetical protein